MATELVPVYTQLPARRRSVIVLTTSGTLRHEDLCDEVGRRFQAQGCQVRRQRLEGICSHLDTSFSDWSVFRCLPIGADRPKSQFKAAFLDSIWGWREETTHIVLFTTQFELSTRFARKWGRKFQLSGIKLAAVMIGDGDPTRLNELARAASGVSYQISEAPAVTAAMPSLLAFAGA